jgi:hypothetical protein
VLLDRAELDELDRLERLDEAARAQVVRLAGADAACHLRTAIARNHELGCTVWAEHAERALARLG